MQIDKELTIEFLQMRWPDKKLIRQRGLIFIEGKMATFEIPDWRVKEEILDWLVDNETHFNDYRTKEIFNRCSVMPDSLLESIMKAAIEESSKQ